MKPEALNRILAYAKDIQSIPAPTFHEAERAEFISQAFQNSGLSEVSIDDLGNVYGCKQNHTSPVLVVSAHMDTVFPEETSLALRRDGSRLIGPGIGDNAIALAVMLEMVNEPFPDAHHSGTIWFVANVREEGLGNLDGMRRVVNRYGGGVNGYIVLEGMGLGHIYNRGLHVQRYRITATTEGGHAWIHAGRDSAVHRLIELGAELVNQPERKGSRRSVNIGTIGGGTSINTIANHASFDLDLRSEDPEVLQAFEQELAKLCSRHRSPDVRITRETIGHRSGGGMPADHPLVRAACEALPAGEVSECVLGAASTDANVPLSMDFPAICIGLTQGGNAHTLEEYIDIETIPNGYKVLQHLLPAALVL